MRFFNFSLALAGISHVATSADFDWDTITPSTNLEYHPCYDEYQCARLLLPLDWHSNNITTDSSTTVIIAIAKLPAAVSPSDPSFAGTVFTQPGGPGGSGTAYLRGSGRKLRAIIDVPGERHYELLSFDPRGVGRSVPRIDCFPGLLGYLRAQERDLAEAVDVSRAALARAVAAGRADGRRCIEEHGEFLRYIGTPYVVKDMVAMLDKVHEERQRRGGQQAMEEEDGEDSSLELRGEPGKDKDDVPRLQYMGISYGTFIGSVFASMFPGRVGRMVLDGVVNPHGYQDGSAAGINDMDEMISILFQGCFNARCPLYRAGDTSGASISDRVWSWASSLDEAPLVIPTSDGNRKYVSAGVVRQLLLSSLYNPVTEFRPLAATLDAAMRDDGDTLPLFNRVLAGTSFTPIPEAQRVNFSSTALAAALPIDAFMGIACADAVDRRHRTLDDWSRFLDEQTGISKLAGPWVTLLQTLCAGWDVRPRWTFRGPFETPEPVKEGQGDGDDAERPAAPMLFLSNRWDPVTPLRDARITRDTFPGAGLVVQETMGHCVTLGAMGACAKDIIAEYFHTGVVPDEEVTCEATRGVWDE